MNLGFSEISGFRFAMIFFLYLIGIKQTLKVTQRIMVL